MKKLYYVCYSLILIVILRSFTATGATVTELTAVSLNGQVFLTWKNVIGTNFQYNVYRSVLPITSATQLISDNYLGYVRDNSGKNIRKSQLKNSNYYFVIANSQPALASDRGLYVATSASSLTYYYAVTVTTLSDNIEDKTITSGNSLLSPVSETVALPQAVLQTITTQGNGDLSYEYVIWGDNQTTSNWRAFNNVGSYGYNFTIQKKGNYNNQPLCIQFIDQGPFKKVGSDFCNDCNILSLDDWLPNGENTYWIGYNDSYNMYVSNNANPINTTNTVRTFSQSKTQEIIRFARRQPNIDSTRVYMFGNSHNGFGALITAMNIPSEISSLYLTSPPLIYKTKNGDIREHQFCKASSNVPTNINYPGTSNPILIWDFCDLRVWYRINKQNGVPYAQGINGKNDTKAGWAQKNHWYDTVNAYHQGGTWFWDQRVHSGTGAQFFDSETKPDYTRYYTNRSWPAFSFCTINQNPGTGSATDGDPYGALNGYLDWNGNSIIDQPCTYSVNCFVKTFYVGGVADAQQYDSCYADITIRQAQSFHPLPGQTVTWTNYGATNNLLQSGSFIYAANPILLPAVKIKKTGSTIALSISNCSGRALSDIIIHDNCRLIKTNESYVLETVATFNQAGQIDVFDLLGRLVLHTDQNLISGLNTIPFTLQSGCYILRASSPEVHFNGQMVF